MSRASDLDMVHAWTHGHSYGRAARLCNCHKMQVKRAVERCRELFPELLLRRSVAFRAVTTGAKRRAALVVVTVSLAVPYASVSFNTF